MKYKDLSGQRIGKLTVIEPTQQRVRNAVVWRCRCDCGNEIFVESRRLKPGVIYSCGCEESPYSITKDLTGTRFGKLTVCLLYTSGRNFRAVRSWWRGF